ncbi:MAG TPA: hypothetical protein DCK95_10370 [Anaerolineaceae bacterium]|nr:hypothetical protein [Anaerolineaceae bacterium]
MSETVFTQVNYTVQALVDHIDLGIIGLPDIQRPFVWGNSKVRDLFDSMYRGYPVGYLLFWQNGITDDASVIGVDKKEIIPSLLIVDGQQRLTSLFSVIHGIPITREDYTTEKLNIAFNPLEEKFEVADAAIRRDKSYIPDISILWSDKPGIIKIINNHIKNLKTTREISDIDEEKIQNAILKLKSLLSFPLTALQLSKNVSEESVAEVFVRINSKGITLNQADFILTLMSVFWDDGRTQLENFCKASKNPSKGVPSPFNYFIEPSPDQLLRVSVGLAFKRARLHYIYSILRGKDLETEQFSDERRHEQFEKLKQAQAKVLNLQYWQDFLKCIHKAGFRSGKMISSQTNLLYTYVLYLIGRTEYGIDEHHLRRVIAQWFFMTSLTGRYTGSSESAMESDLARFREVTDREEFLNILLRICDLELTEDFWNITLPNALATSSPRSPSLFAYNAALVNLETNALFSDMKVSDLFEPSITGTKSAVERHHLFPKGYLATIGISDLREMNQIANYAYMEYLDNIDISDQAPADYIQEYKKRFDHKLLNKMYHWHALPENWEYLDYSEFLEKRRELMAQIISEGYQKLKLKESSPIDTHELSLSEIINLGETHQIEFKATLRTNLHTNERDPRMEYTVLRTIAGFLNTNGGILTIGVYDDGTPLGIEVDEFENEDKMSLHLVNIIKSRLNTLVMPFVHIHFDNYEKTRVMVVECSRAHKPVFLKDEKEQRFFIRTGPSTTELKADEIMDYTKIRFV